MGCGGRSQRMRHKQKYDKILSTINIVFYMGSDSSKLYSEKEIPQEFRPIHTEPNVYQNILTGVRLQKHTLHFSNQSDLNYEKDIFMFRRMHSDRFLPAHYFENTNQQSFCSQSYQICYFVELPARQFHAQQKIHSQNAFRLLIECLKGYDLLFQKFGPFKFNHRQMCFDSHGTLKVWISQNLFATHILGASSRQHAMIQDIFDLFDEIRDERGCLMNFNSYLQRLGQRDRNYLTFKKVLSYLIGEASKFFNVRDKRTQNQRFKLDKENHSGGIHTISLRTKTKPKCTFGSNYSNNGKQICQQSNPSSPKPEFKQVEVKKSRRYNSQENCSSKEENYLINSSQFSLIGPSNDLKLASTGPSSFLPPKPSSMQFTHRHNRRSADNIIYEFKEQSQIPQTYRMAQQKADPHRWSLSNGAKGMQQNFLQDRPTIKQKPVREPKRGKMVTEANPLSQLQTIKSIHDFDCLQIDSMIRVDLERMGINAESRIL